MRIALVVAALAVLAGCSRRPELPVYGQVPRFTLTAESGEQFDSAALVGKIWVADFMFTRCMGPCPRMASRMHWVQKQAASVQNLRLVSDGECDLGLSLGDARQRRPRASDARQ